MKNLKITSALLSIAMVLTLVTPSVEVMADETSVPTETQEIEAAENTERKTSEKKTTKTSEKKDNDVKETQAPIVTEKQEPKETETKETEATETQAPKVTEKQEPEATDPKETEELKEKETGHPVPTESRTSEPSGTEKQESETTEKTKPNETESPSSEKEITEPSETEQPIPEVTEKGDIESEAKKDAKDAITGKCGNILNWSWDEEDTLTISGSGAMNNWTSASSVPWKDYANKIKTVILPNGITSIGNYAFSGCIELSTIELPDSITSIGECAFSGSGITTISIPSGVTSISKETFSSCSNLSSISLPDSIISIGESAFNGSGITTISIPNGVTSIGKNSFTGCSQLSSIVLPDSITSIGEGAFCGSGLKSITIPNKVTSISDSMFANCEKLTSVTFHKNVISVGEMAFQFCSSLTIIKDYENVKTIGFAAFSFCHSLESFAFPNKVTSIARGTFYNCEKLKNVTIPDSVTSIGSSAFYNCSSLTLVVLPYNLDSIGEEAFEGCSCGVILNENLTDREKAFTNFTGYIMPYCTLSYTNDGHGTITGKTYTYRDDVMEFTITPEANYHLEKVTFDGGELIPDQNGRYTMPFKLGSAVIKATFVKNAASGTFGNNLSWTLSDTGLLDISGKGAMPDYLECSTEDKNPTPWKEYKNDIKSIRLSAGITSIGNYAFCGCTNLISFSMPDGVTTVGDYAFSNCPGLTSVWMPSSVTTIGKSAFGFCSGIKTAKINTGIISIGDEAFTNCTSLTYIQITQNVTKVGDSAFEGCSSLKTVVFPEVLVSIGNAAFKGCNSLTSVTLPESVNSVGENAFKDCSKLADVVLPYNLTALNTGVFDGCISLTHVLINKSAYNPDSFPECPDNTFQFYYGISYSNDGHGMITGKNYSYEGETIKLTYTPEYGYVINEANLISGNATFKLTPDNSDCTITVTMPYSEGDVTIKATFKNTIASGTCGKKLSWILNGAGTLIISGSGAMDNWDSLNHPQWISYSTEIKSVVISENVTSIGNLAFIYYSNIESVSIPVSVTTIGNFAFNGCKSLTKVIYGGTDIDWAKISIGSYNQELTNATLLTKIENTLVAKGGKTAKVKYKKLRKKAQAVARSKVMTISNPQGNVTYKLASVSKSKYKKFFTINAKNGVVTVKKKLKKGTYTIKVSVTAAGNDDYKIATKTVAFKIKVK